MIVGLVDTTILVDVLRQYQPALNWLKQQVDLGVTSVNQLELVFGAQNKIAQQQSVKLLSTFQIVYLEAADQKWAHERLLMHKLKDGIGINDCLIASVSHRLQVPLYTHNFKHILPVLGSTLTIRPY